jgi:hypothetical protein
MQSMPRAAAQLQVRLEASEDGQTFTLDLNGMCYTLQGDMVYDRVVGLVQNAIRPFTNELDQVLRNNRKKGQR